MDVELPMITTFAQSVGISGCMKVVTVGMAGSLNY